MPPPEIPPTARRFPSITRLRKWQGSADDYLSFQIVGFHPDRQPYRLLYVAETTGPERETILVKFVQEYSIELHDFCAKRGHAPRIFAFETLPGGWRVVAMELTGITSAAAQITRSRGLDTHRTRWASELKQLVNEFHEEDLVHGDLRTANMISDDEYTLMLVDFDWGGKDGQVSYPTLNLNDELLVGRVSDDLKITKSRRHPGFEPNTEKAQTVSVGSFHRSIYMFTLLNPLLSYITGRLERRGLSVITGEI